MNSPSGSEIVQFFLSVKIDKMAQLSLLKTGVVLVPAPSERPASRAVNRGTGAEMVLGSSVLNCQRAKK
jgi:hypothetical protein